MGRTIQKQQTKQGIYRAQILQQVKMPLKCGDQVKWSNLIHVRSNYRSLTSDKTKYSTSSEVFKPQWVHLCLRTFKLHLKYQKKVDLLNNISIS